MAGRADPRGRPQGVALWLAAGSVRADAVRMHPLAQVHADAVRLGYIDARACALPDGVHPRTLRDHTHRIGWVPWMPGFWVPGEKDPPYDVRCRIVLASLGTDALLTGASALWALGVLRSEPARVEVLVPASSWRRVREGVCVHYATDFAAVRGLAAQGFRVTRAARSVAEHARHEAVTPLCRVIADATRLRHCTLGQIDEEIDARIRFPGRGTLRLAHGQLTGELNHSGPERLGRRLLRQVGVQVPARPGPVVHRQRTVAEVDIPWEVVARLRALGSTAITAVTDE